MGSHAPLQPGDRAPGFTLHSVQDPRTVSLDDYRGRTPLFLGLFNGLYCPFCRRSLVHMARCADQLRPLGIESLAVIATEVDNARLYVRFRPTKLPLAADPELTTHQSYGVPRPEVTPELMEAITNVRINPNDELPEPMSIEQAEQTLTRLDAYQPNETDRRDGERQFPQLKGQFLIDRDGVIRWVNIEAQEGLSGLGRFPSPEELVAAAALARI